MINCWRRPASMQQRRRVSNLLTSSMCTAMPFGPSSLSLESLLSFYRRSFPTMLTLTSAIASGLSPLSTIFISSGSDSPVYSFLFIFQLPFLLEITRKVRHSSSNDRDHSIALPFLHRTGTILLAVPLVVFLWLVSLFV